MTPDDLETIRRRARDVAAYAHSADERRLARDDVPALIAEIDRLSTELEVEHLAALNEARLFDEARAESKHLRAEIERLTQDNARREGICGDAAPTLVHVGEDGTESGAGVICELSHGHKSAWHEAPDQHPGLPPMRWRNTTVPSCPSTETPMAERDCTCDACEISTYADLARGERVYTRGRESEDCPYHGYRKVYLGTDGKHYPTRAEAGWNER